MGSRLYHGSDIITESLDFFINVAYVSKLRQKRDYCVAGWQGRYPMSDYPSFRLDGQTALVTGAARGLGRAISLALADALRSSDDYCPAALRKAARCTLSSPVPR